MHGRCRGLDPSVFFPPDGERGWARARREEQAKEICRRCPVIAQCRAHALRVGEAFGVWGGLAQNERERILAKSHAAPRSDRAEAALTVRR